MQNLTAKALATLGILTLVLLTGCASITTEATTPISLRFSDDSKGHCHLQNKRMTIEKQEIPSTVQFRKSDDSLVYDCENEHKKTATGEIPSSIAPRVLGIWGNFIIGGGVGAIVDANTDKHREYPANFTIPIASE